MKSVTICGANGYLGKHLTQVFLKAGISVRALVHSPWKDSPDGVVTYHYNLSDKPSSEALLGSSVFIHAAHDFQSLTLKESLEVNLEGSVRLFSAAREAGVQTIIFISSMAAYTGCRSIYGKVKLAIEKEALQIGAWVIRPGTIYGGSGEGLFGALRTMATKLPIIPLLDGGSQLFYLVHIDDLCEILMQIGNSTLKPPREPISLGANVPLSLRFILSELNKAADKSSPLLPVPGWMVLPFMQLAERLGLPLPFRSDSLISLRFSNPSPNVKSSFLGVNCREFLLPFRGKGSPIGNSF